MLDDDLKARINRLLFFQRPIAAQEHLIGFCELEPEERRAPWAFLEAQRFRVIQKVNDLKVIEHGKVAERPLTDDESKAVFAKLGVFRKSHFESSIKSASVAGEQATSSTALVPSHQGAPGSQCRFLAHSQNGKSGRDGYASHRRVRDDLLVRYNELRHGGDGGDAQQLVTRVTPTE